MIFLAFSMLSLAYDFEVDGIYYDKNSPVFDLNGRQLSEKPASGYYIQGGKKYYTK